MITIVYKIIIITIVPQPNTVMAMVAKIKPICPFAGVTALTERKNIKRTAPRRAQ